MFLNVAPGVSPASNLSGTSILDRLTNDDVPCAQARETDPKVSGDSNSLLGGFPQSLFMVADVSEPQFLLLLCLLHLISR